MAKVLPVIWNIANVIIWSLFALTAIGFIGFLWVAMNYYLEEFIKDLVKEQPKDTNKIRNNSKTIINVSTGLLIILGIYFFILGYTQCVIWYYICSAGILIVLPVFVVITLCEKWKSMDARKYAQRVELENKQAKEKQEEVKKYYQKMRGDRDASS